MPFLSAMKWNVMKRFPSIISLGKKNQVKKQDKKMKEKVKSAAGRERLLHLFPVLLENAFPSLSITFPYPYSQIMLK